MGKDIRTYMKKSCPFGCAVLTHFLGEDADASRIVTESHTRLVEMLQKHPAVFQKFSHEFPAVRVTVKDAACELCKKAGQSAESVGLAFQLLQVCVQLSTWEGVVDTTSKDLSALSAHVELKEAMLKLQEVSEVFDEDEVEQDKGMTLLQDEQTQLSFVALASRVEVCKKSPCAELQTICDEGERICDRMAEQAEKLFLVHLQTAVNEVAKLGGTDWKKNLSKSSLWPEIVQACQTSVCTEQFASDACKPVRRQEVSSAQ